MNLISDAPLSALQFYVTAPYPCSYLPERTARSRVAVPGHLIDTQVYGELVKLGFRRSGTFTYRPHCSPCRACVPVRIPVEEFRRNRTQRRTFKHHAALEVRVRKPEYHPEHYALYLRYQAARHPGGGMDQDSREQYDLFLLQSPVETKLLEFHDAGMLRMVSIVDFLPDGLSSVYTFFDPGVQGASFGTYSILWQIALCRHLQLPFLYLGYWIAQSDKMSYKIRFQPMQALIHGRWVQHTGAV